MELDLQKAVEPQQATNGNSLFAEVDDRRRRLEKENRIYKGTHSFSPPSCPPKICGIRVLGVCTKL